MKDGVSHRVNDDDVWCAYGVLYTLDNDGPVQQGEARMLG